jgi:hypothetical protein
MVPLLSLDRGGLDRLEEPAVAEPVNPFRDSTLDENASHAQAIDL